MASQKETAEGIQSVVSVKVTSDITAFCKASNEFGVDTATFNIKASEFRPLLHILSLLSLFICAPLCCLFLLYLNVSRSAMHCDVLPVIPDMSLNVVVVLD